LKLAAGRRGMSCLAGIRILIKIALAGYWSSDESHTRGVIHLIGLLLNPKSVDYASLAMNLMIE
jgi:hypothetical protein